MDKTKQAGRRRRARNKTVMAADVARLAGVSISAVSRTFTAGASVSEGTRHKVLEAARSLKYRPAQTSLTPKLKRSHIVGFAVSRLDDLFYARVAERLSDALAKLDYRLLLFITHGDTRLDPVHRELLHFRVDALILATANPSFPLADECRDFGIPLIMLNNVNTGGDTASVSGANFSGGRQIASFLLAGGHKKFAYMAGIEHTSMSIEREAGFNSILAQRGIKSGRAVGHYTFEGAAQAARKLLSAKDRPDAVFCCTDHMAMACIQVARSEFGLIPGKHISIVGFDNVEVASWPTFDLTTFSQPIDRMVDQTVEMLRTLLDGGRFENVHQVVPGELIVRSSARIPAEGVRPGKDGGRVWSPKS